MVPDSGRSSAFGSSSSDTAWFSDPLRSASLSERSRKQFDGLCSCSLSAASTAAEDSQRWTKRAWTGDKLEGRASDHLRRLLNSVVSAESQLDRCQDQNYNMRVRCFQQLRNAVVARDLRGPFSEWASQCCRNKMEARSKERHSKFIGRLGKLLARMSTQRCSGLDGSLGDDQGSERSLLLGASFRGWRSVLWDLTEEKLMLEEIEVHRQGRGQLIRQYRDLEAELETERLANEQLRAQCQESAASTQRLREEVGWIASRLEQTTRGAEESSSREKAFAAELRESQERVATLRRELHEQRELHKSIQAQVQQGIDERRQLHEAAVRAEREADNARKELRMVREAEVGHCKASLRHSENTVAALETELSEARKYIESFSRGAAVFLSSHGDVGGQAAANGPNILPTRISSVSASPSCGNNAQSHRLCEAVSATCTPSFPADGDNSRIRADVSEVRSRMLTAFGKRRSSLWFPEEFDEREGCTLRLGGG